MHGTITEPTCLAEAMLAHCPANTEPPSRSRYHEGSVRHVRAKAELIRLQDVRADDLAIILRDVGARPPVEPIGQRLIARRFRVEHVSVPVRDNRVEDPPHGIPIRLPRFANGHHAPPLRPNERMQLTGPAAWLHDGQPQSSRPGN